ncbi:MAG TPA: DUF3093 domain-containing protein [Microlunatus sp.]
MSAAIRLVPVSYREWVGPPPGWWVLSVLFSLSWLVAIGFYLGPLAGILGLLGAQGLVTLVLLGTAVRLRLDGTELRVGRAVLDLAYVSAVRGLDVQATAARTGPEADARAHLVLRPYAKTAVELTLDDPADPVPYWVVSTRRPTQLAEAVAVALTEAIPRRSA